jgi:hypothetical protein
MGQTFVSRLPGESTFHYWFRQVFGNWSWGVTPVAGVVGGGGAIVGRAITVTDGYVSAERAVFKFSEYY